MNKFDWIVFSTLPTIVILAILYAYNIINILTYYLLAAVLCAIIFTCKIKRDALGRVNE